MTSDNRVLYLLQIGPRRLRVLLLLCELSLQIERVIALLVQLLQLAL